jgi:hypothetical protein|mmetsp:Transcript_27146/g.25969  ORF Transcript_27146/g.25969 Transcript_27146/m.25969 type:complete len:147 (-) Transcript_27146:491-931(-)
MMGWSEEFKILALADSMQTVTDEEVVMLSQVIAHSCNIGYEMNKNLRLMKFNNVEIRNLKQLKELVDGLDSPNESKDSSKKVSKNGKSSKKSTGEKSQSSSSMVFEFSNGQIVVLDGREALGAKDQICREHFIPSFCSADLLDIEK